MTRYTAPTGFIFGGNGFLYLGKQVFFVRMFVSVLLIMYLSKWNLWHSQVVLFYTAPRELSVFGADWLRRRPNRLLSIILCRENLSSGEKRAEDEINNFVSYHNTSTNCHWPRHPRLPLTWVSWAGRLVRDWVDFLERNNVIKNKLWYFSLWYLQCVCSFPTLILVVHQMHGELSYVASSRLVC